MMHVLLSSARRTLISHRIYRTTCVIRHGSTISTAVQKLRSSGPARTRFAPSPTGHLHLGSLRTALFNYLVAKATGGQFLLRIEDTDQQRTVPNAAEKLYEDLRWAGIDWDEGPKVGGPCGPYIQSQRIEIYKKNTEQLLESGNAYRCFCSSERLDTLASHRHSIGQSSGYDRACTHVSKEESDDRAAKGEAHVIRLKVPDKYPVYNDLVYGLVRQRGDPEDKLRGKLYADPILIKSDGWPTYHLANVVDDHLMSITHVIRGTEWMSSTPKHLATYKAFGWEPPKFAHVSLLVDQTGAKLSKRSGSVHLSEWREKGVFPEVLNNFVALLGWSHDQKSDIMNMDELIQNASLKFTKGDTTVAFEKLWFLQKRHAHRYATTSTSSRVTLNNLAAYPINKALSERPDLNFYHSLPKTLTEASISKEDLIHSLLTADAQNYTSPTEFIDRNIFFFTSPTTEDLLKATCPNLSFHHYDVLYSHQSLDPEALRSFFSEVADEEWTTANLKTVTNKLIGTATDDYLRNRSAKEKNGELGKTTEKAWGKIVHGYIRWAIAAGRPGPDGAVSMQILGKGETLRRLERGKEVVVEMREKEGGEE